MPTKLRLGRGRDCAPLIETQPLNETQPPLSPTQPPSNSSSAAPRMINAGFDKLSAVEIDIDAVAHSVAPQPMCNDANVNDGSKSFDPPLCNYRVCLHHNNND